MPDDELKKLLLVKAGDVFSREKLNATTKAISDRLGKEGGPFCQRQCFSGKSTRKSARSRSRFLSIRANGFNVRRINVTGIPRRADEVIRREVRQMEGGWYDASTRSPASKQRVDKLGSSPRLLLRHRQSAACPISSVAVHLNVTEKPTGNLMLVWH